MDSFATDSLVSVILPTRNRSQLLPRAIKSLFAQTHRELEIMIVDDASTDKTPEVIKGFIDSRIHYIRLESAKGPGAARNAGMGASQGHLIAFLDDDDEFMPEKIATQVNAFQKVNEAVAVLIGDVQVMHNGKEVQFFPYDGVDGAIFLHVLGGNMIPLNAVLIRRDVVAAFDEKLPCLEEFDFLLKVLQHTKAAYQDAPCSVYHVDTNRKRLSGDRIALQKAFRILRERWFNDPEDLFLKNAQSDLLMRFALRMLAMGMTDDETRGYFKEALKRKKNAQRLWYGILGLAGPAAMKLLGPRLG